MAHHASVLGAAIQQAMNAKGVKQVDVSEHFGVDAATVSRWLNGKIDLTVSRVIEIERFLDLEPGELFIRAGLVTLPKTTEEAIRADPALNPFWVHALLTTYRGAILDSVGTDSAGNNSRSDNRRPAANKTTRT